jgi:hypothetical protein
MSGKPSVIAVLAVTMCILGASAAAQDEVNQLTGMIGRTFISDQGLKNPSAPILNPFIRSGKGITFGINYSRRLWGTAVYSISGEVPAAFNLDEDLNSGYNYVPTDYKQIFVTPSVRVNLFPATAVSPWVSFGGGFGHFSEGKTLIYGGKNPGGSSTTGVMQGGLGLDVNPFQHRFSRFGFRGEVRDFWSGTPSFPLAVTGKTRQHNFFVSGGVIWHF